MNFGLRFQGLVFENVASSRHALHPSNGILNEPTIAVIGLTKQLYEATIPYG